MSNIVLNTRKSWNWGVKKKENEITIVKIPKYHNVLYKKYTINKIK